MFLKFYTNQFIQFRHINHLTNNKLNVFHCYKINNKRNQFKIKIFKYGTLRELSLVYFTQESDRNSENYYNISQNIIISDNSQGNSTTFPNFYYNYE